jgi:hypothetical protein
MGGPAAAKASTFSVVRAVLNEGGQMKNTTKSKPKGKAIKIQTDFFWDYPLYPFRAGGIAILVLDPRERGKYGVYKFSAKDKDTLSNTVGRYISLATLRAYLAKHCNITQDWQNLSWHDIFAALELCLKEHQERTTTLEGELSKPMAKVDIMKRLGMGLKGYRKLETYCKDHPLHKVGNNRQLWQIRIDKMPVNLKEKFK